MLFARMSALGPSTVAPGTIAASAAVGTSASTAIRLARARRLMSCSLSGAQRFVQRLVDQLVGSLVLLPAHRAHRPRVELAQRAHRLEEEWLQPGVLDLVLAADLAGHQLRVVDHLDLAGAQVARQLQPCLLYTSDAADEEDSV